MQDAEYSYLSRLKNEAYQVTKPSIPAGFKRGSIASLGRMDARLRPSGMSLTMRVHCMLGPIGIQHGKPPVLYILPEGMRSANAAPSTYSMATKAFDLKS